MQSVHGCNSPGRCPQLASNMPLGTEPGIQASFDVPGKEEGDPPPGGGALTGAGGVLQTTLVSNRLKYTGQALDCRRLCREPGASQFELLCMQIEFRHSQPATHSQRALCLAEPCSRFLRTHVLELDESTANAWGARQDARCHSPAYAPRIHDSSLKRSSINTFVQLQGAVQIAAVGTATSPRAAPCAPAWSRGGPRH